MTCEETRLLLEACVDGELDTMRTLRVEEHMDTCAACRSRYDGQKALHETIQSQAQYFEAPKHLQARVQNALRDAERSRRGTPATSARRGWRYAAIAAGIAFLAISTVALVMLLKSPSTSELLAQQVVASHIRSLMANHLMDVASSDQHTVKPWFNGKLDFAPVVKDLAAEGFPLTGGRLDYLAGRPIAALLYKRHQHTINLFQWPSAASDSNTKAFTIKGYHAIRWTHAGMAYWAVSDLNPAELADFMRDLRR
jgi:anti-sigma factor RsiW